MSFIRNTPSGSWTRAWPGPTTSTLRGSTRSPAKTVLLSKTPSPFVLSRMAIRDLGSNMVAPSIAPFSMKVGYSMTHRRPSKSQLIDTGLSSCGSAAAICARKPGAMVMVLSSSAGERASVEIGRGVTAGGQASAPRLEPAKLITPAATMARALTPSSNLRLIRLTLRGAGGGQPSARIASHLTGPAGN